VCLGPTTAHSRRRAGKEAQAEKLEGGGARKFCIIFSSFFAYRRLCLLTPPCTHLPAPTGHPRSARRSRRAPQTASGSPPFTSRPVRAVWRAQSVWRPETRRPGPTQGPASAAKIRRRTAAKNAPKPTGEVRTPRGKPRTRRGLRQIKSRGSRARAPCMVSCVREDRGSIVRAGAANQKVVSWWARVGKSNRT